MQKGRADGCRQDRGCRQKHLNGKSLATAKCGQDGGESPCKRNGGILCRGDGIGSDVRGPLDWVASHEGNPALKVLNRPRNYHRAACIPYWFVVKEAAGAKIGSCHG
jgi:hypothetical protein